MPLYKELEKRREIVKDFIRANPKTTFRNIKSKLHIKVNKLYFGGMEEAFREAGVKPPRTLKFKKIEERRKIIIDYIRKNPTAGGQTIKKETKINLQAIFKNTKEAFQAAGVYYPRENYFQLIKRDADVRRKKIIELIKKDPLMGFDKVGNITNTHPHSLFKNTKEIYKAAGIPFVSKGDKRRIKKQNLVVEYIKKNTFATQREINRVCKTKVQVLFSKGIFDAYLMAGVTFPYNRLKFHGSALKEIREDAERFELEITKILSGYGSVNRLVRTKRGIADIILERKEKKVAVELKNYKCHEISISQIKQVNRYLEDIGSNLGFLVCLKKPKKDTFLIGKNKIMVVTKSELSKIPQVMDL